MGKNEGAVPYVIIISDFLQKIPLFCLKLFHGSMDGSRAVKKDFKHLKNFQPIYISFNDFS